MKEKTPEEIQRIVDKWKHVLEGPTTPLSAACEVILLESQEQWFSEKDGKRFSSFEEREQYDRTKTI